MFGAFTFGHPYFAQSPDIIVGFVPPAGPAGADGTWTVRPRVFWSVTKRDTWTRD